MDKRDTYGYEGCGNRIEKDVDADGDGSGAAVVSKFALDGWDPAKGSGAGNDNWDVWGDLASSGFLLNRYLRGDVVDQVFAGVSGSSLAVTWYLTDIRGSVRDIVDNWATVGDSITYDAFGNITAETNSAYRGRYAWTGRELDVET